jgi:hypothetical protein
MVGDSLRDAISLREWYQNGFMTMKGETRDGVGECGDGVH